MKLKHLQTHFRITSLLEENHLNPGLYFLFLFFFVGLGCRTHFSPDGDGRFLIFVIAI